MTAQTETTPTEVIEPVNVTTAAEEAAMEAMAVLQSSPEYMELLEVHNEVRNALLSAKDQYGNYKHSTREVQTLLERYRVATVAHHEANKAAEVPSVIKVIPAEPVEVTETDEA